MTQAQLLEAYRLAIRSMQEGNFNVSLPIESSDTSLEILGKELMELGQSLDKRFNKLHRIKKISGEISHGLFTHEVLNRVFETFHELIPFDRIGCALISEDRRSAKSWWVRSGYPRAVKLPEGYQAKLAGSSLQTIINSGMPRIINDLEAYLDKHPKSVSTQLVVAEGIRSSLTCPLIAENKPVGFLFFSSREKNTYHPDHQLGFMEIANHLSVLMERSRFYQKIYDLNQELLRAQDALKERALRDMLTGLLNRGAIMESLDEHLDYAQRQHKPLSILMIDIDHFKQINDNHGHLAGDAVLKTVAATLQSCLRTHDRLGRFGGEEFLIVLRDTEPHTATQVAERIRTAVAAQCVTFENKTLQITLSLGVASLAKNGTIKPASLLSHADAALYKAKQAGRNRVCIADD